jgi:hypothetical protein
MKPYSYIGTADIKYLDKEGTKLGAFLSIDWKTCKAALEELERLGKQEIKINVLPKKSGEGYSVKLIY